MIFRKILLQILILVFIFFSFNIYAQNNDYFAWLSWQKLSWDAHEKILTGEIIYQVGCQKNDNDDYCEFNINFSLEDGQSCLFVLKKNNTGDKSYRYDNFFGRIPNISSAFMLMDRNVFFSDDIFGIGTIKFEDNKLKYDFYFRQPISWIDSSTFTVLHEDFAENWKDEDYRLAKAINYNIYGNTAGQEGLVTETTPQEIMAEFKSIFLTKEYKIDDMRIDAPVGIRSLNLSEETAIKIAEAILVSKFGEKVLEQRPWIVTDNGDDFEIEGTAHFDSKTMGGVAKIVICKSDGKVLEYSHGK